jgi:hypothetical protein
MKYNIEGAVEAYGIVSGQNTSGLIEAFEKIEDGFITNGLGRIKSKVLRIITAECTQSLDGYIYGSNHKKIMKNSCLPPTWIGISDVNKFRDFMDDNGLLVTDIYPIAVVSKFYRKGKVKIGKYLEEYSDYQAERIADIISKKNIEKVIISSRYKCHQDKTDIFTQKLQEAINNKCTTPMTIISRESISGRGGFLDKDEFEIFRTS